LSSRIRALENPLALFYFSDPRLFLVPIEHLTPAGMSAVFVELLLEHRDWTPAHVALFNEGFSLYWARTAALAAETRSWAPPRLRHVAVLHDPVAVLPYVQLLNTSAWTLYDCDFDPSMSHAEFVAYLFAHGDRMALTGEVTLAALRNAAYWFDRSAKELSEFRQAAGRSQRPDAEAFRVLADATEWLRDLRHDTLRPPKSPTGYHSIPTTGLLVPPAMESAPPALVDTWTRCARQTVERFRRQHRAADHPAVLSLLEWLAVSTPPVLVTARNGRILWDPDTPARLGPLRNELRRAGGAAVRDIHADLSVLDEHTRRFLAALVDVDSLSKQSDGLEQSGYTFLHPVRRLLAYNLDEPDIDRLHGPSLPYARAMLGARALHEWAHVAVDSGFVPRAVSEDEEALRVSRLAELLEAAVRGAPESVRRQTEEDINALGPRAEAKMSVGTALARVLLARMSDYQANLLASRFWNLPERETYVRQNIRTLRAEYSPAQIWRMLVRYLYEYQYSRFSAVEDHREYFLRSTWFDADFFTTGIIDEEQFDRLVSSAAAICAGYAVDDTRFHP
jgi:hypothetical protein